MPYLLYIEERVIDKNTYFLLEKSGRVSFFEKIKQPHAHTSLFLYSYCFIGCPPTGSLFAYTRSDSTRIKKITSTMTITGLTAFAPPFSNIRAPR